MPLFLGLDCGGSTTRALVVDDDETVVFEGRGGPANLASTPHDVVESSLRDATSGMPKVDAAVGCFAGLLGHPGHETAIALLESVAPGVKKGAFPDYVASLAAAPEGTDVVVVAGTGSVVCSWRDGQSVKTGGGGPWLGDEGSAFDVGRHAMKYLCLDDPTAHASDQFWVAVQTQFGTTDRTSLPSCVGRSPRPAAQLASLAPLVGTDFEHGFVYARAAVVLCMSKLAHLLEAHVLEHLSDRDAVSVRLAGGLWEAGPVYEACFRRFSEHTGKGDPNDPGHRQYHVERLGAPPVLGAARLAKVLFHEH